MEVIRRGVKKAKSAVVVCRECDSELRIHENDGDFISDFRDGDCRKVSCPICQREMYVDCSLFK